MIKGRDLGVIAGNLLFWFHRDYRILRSNATNLRNCRDIAWLIQDKAASVPSPWNKAGLLSIEPIIMKRWIYHSKVRLWNLMERKWYPPNFEEFKEAECPEAQQKALSDNQIAGNRLTLQEKWKRKDYEWLLRSLIRVCKNWDQFNWDQKMSLRMNMISVRHNFE